MAVQCPFCGEEWMESMFLEELIDDTHGLLYEGGQCECGAWWYEGMEDVEDD